MRFIYLLLLLLYYLLSVCALETEAATECMMNNYEAHEKVKKRYKVPFWSSFLLSKNESHRRSFFVVVASPYYSLVSFSHYLISTAFLHSLLFSSVEVGERRKERERCERNFTRGVL